MNDTNNSEDWDYIYMGLAIAAAKIMKQDLYITQCTVDTKPEDLIVSPVIADNGKIRYVASPLVSAMIKGGICLLDEGNRMGLSLPGLALAKKRRDRAEQRNLACEHTTTTSKVEVAARDAVVG